MLEIQSNAYFMFTYGIRSPLTRKYYERRLKTFFDFIDLQGTTIEERCNTFAERAIRDNTWALNCIIKFLQFQKERVERKEITAATLRNFVKAIKLFCEMSDIQIQWKKITRGFPKVRRYADDRAPTLDEITKIMEYPDRRIKAIIYTMISSGIRLGAWDYLRWGDILPLKKDSKIIAARLKIYAGDNEEYFTFITPEAYLELEKWMKYREQTGETINEKSWLMRNLWNTKKGYTHGLVTAPKKLKSSGIKRLVEDALWTQGVRTKLEKGIRRHNFQADHGFRKWFKTRCELAGMKSINIEILMGHSIGISDSYYRATENEILQDYLKSVDFLTIHDETRLRKQIMEMRGRENEIEVSYEEKDQKIKTLSEQVASIKSQMEPVLNAIASIDSTVGKSQVAETLVKNGVYQAFTNS